MSLREALRTIVAFSALQVASLSMARAHGGELPQALSVVASDVQGTKIVRLNEGLAMRRPEGFRFVCPALWGEDEVVPAQSLAEGSTLLGTSTGLFVLADDGSALRHGDPAATGRVIALGASAQRVYALREREAYELLEVSKEAVRVLWRDDMRWEDMAVADGFVTLMRIEAGRLFALRLSPEGSVLAQNEVEVPATATHVRARVAGTTSYAVLLSSALRAELGRIDQGRFLSLQSAGAIAGPVETHDGQRFTALDGKLARFDSEQISALSEPQAVSCLGRQGDISYACSAGDLRSLASDGLGPTLFALKDLLEPERERLPEALRETCMLQWQRFTIDLLRLGIKPRSVAADAGTSATARDAGVADQPDADEGETGSEPSDAQRMVAVASEDPTEADQRSTAPESSEQPRQDSDESQQASTTRARARSAGCHCTLSNAQGPLSSTGLALFACLARIAAKKPRSRRFPRAASEAPAGKL